MSLIASRVSMRPQSWRKGKGATPLGASGEPQPKGQNRAGAKEKHQGEEKIGYPFTTFGILSRTFLGELDSRLLELYSRVSLVNLLVIIQDYLLG